MGNTHRGTEGNRIPGSIQEAVPGGIPGGIWGVCLSVCWLWGMLAWGLIGLVDLTGRMRMEAELEVGM